MDAGPALIDATEYVLQRLVHVARVLRGCHGRGEQGFVATTPVAV